MNLLKRLRVLSSMTDQDVVEMEYIRRVREGKTALFAHGNLVVMTTQCRDRMRELAARKLEWISVKDRTPDHGVYCLVAYYGSKWMVPENGETMEESWERLGYPGVVTVGYLTNEGWCGADDYQLSVQPIFWRPLPDAPQYPKET